MTERKQVSALRGWDELAEVEDLGLDEGPIVFATEQLLWPLYAMPEP